MGKVCGVDLSLSPFVVLSWLLLMHIQSQMLSPWALPRGGQVVESSYASKLEAVKEQVLTSTLPSVRIYFCFLVLLYIYIFNKNKKWREDH